MAFWDVKQPGNDPQSYVHADQNAPLSVCELSAAWMTQAMRAARSIGPRDFVASFQVDPFKPSGRAMTGELSRVSAVYDPPGAGPESLIAKFACSDRAAKGMFEQADTYAREIFFYRDLAPLVPLRVPSHYASGLTPGRSRDRPSLARIVDALPVKAQLALATDVTKLMRATNRHYALMIEDCSAGNEVFNLARPPSSDRLAVALDSLAGMHARFWGGGREAARHPSTGVVITRTPGLYANELRHRALGIAQDTFSSWWSDNHTALALDAADRFAAGLASLSTPITLIHGDPRSDNLLFPSAGGPPVFVDWGAPAIAHPAWDVSYLLGSSLQASSSDAADELISGYHRSLSERGARLHEADLRESIVSGWKAQLIFVLLSIRVMPVGSSYGDAGNLHDLWVAAASSASGPQLSRAARWQRYPTSRASTCTARARKTRPHPPSRLRSPPSRRLKA